MAIFFEHLVLDVDHYHIIVLFTGSRVMTITDHQMPYGHAISVLSLAIDGQNLRKTTKYDIT